MGNPTRINPRRPQIPLPRWRPDPEEPDRVGRDLEGRDIELRGFGGYTRPEEADEILADRDAPVRHGPKARGGSYTKRGAAHRGAKVGPMDAYEVCHRRHCRGEMYTVIAEDLPIGSASVRRIACGETWTHLEIPCRREALT